ncbi:MAG: aminotransferase class IV, partial [Gaiellaceae bacterium]
MTLLAVAVGGRGVVDPAEPVLRADDEALLRGRAAFETIRVYGGVPFKLAEHLDRLAGSAAQMALPEVNRLELDALAQQALDAAGTPDAVLRLYWTPTPVALALVSALPDRYDDLRKRGQRLISLRGIRADEPWLLPGVKSTSYAVNIAAEAEAKRQGAD